MATFTEMLYHMGGVPVGGADSISLNGGKTVFLDPANGADGNAGSTPTTAVKTWAVAKAIMTTAKNDRLVIMGGSTSVATTAAIDWDLNYCHIVGATSPLDVGQRARITGTAGNAITDLFTVSGTGNTFSNLQFYNGTITNVATGAVKVTGARNFFSNCYFAGTNHATPGANSGAYDLYVSGAECEFHKCAIGNLSAAKSAAIPLRLVNADDITFRDCKFRMFCDTAGNYIASYTNADGSTDTYFIDCIFSAVSTNNGTATTNAFTFSTASKTGNILLKGTVAVGFTGWGADNAQTFYIFDAAGTAATSGLAVKANS